MRGYPDCQRMITIHDMSAAMMPRMHNNANATIAPKRSLQGEAERATAPGQSECQRSQRSDRCHSSRHTPIAFMRMYTQAPM